MQKTIIITGGSRGIGFAIAKIFAENNFKVCITGKNKENLAKSKLKLEKISPNNILTFAFDIASKEEVLKFGKDYLLKNKTPHVLVNNAGIFIPGSLINEANNIFEQQLNTNLVGSYHTTRCFIKNMIKQHGEYIFNICSTASTMAYPNGGSYSISKYGLLGFSKSLRQELKETSIAVSAVLPGATFTDSWAGTKLPKERFIDPKDIAQIIWTAYTMRKTAVQEEIVIRPPLGDI